MSLPMHIWECKAIQSSDAITSPDVDIKFILYLEQPTDTIVTVNSRFSFIDDYLCVLFCHFLSTTVVNISNPRLDSAEKNCVFDHNTTYA